VDECGITDYLVDLIPGSGSLHLFVTYFFRLGPGLGCADLQINYRARHKSLKMPIFLGLVQSPKVVFEMVGIKTSLCVVVALLGLIEAVAIPAYHEVHEKRGTLHRRWTKRDRVESHKLLPMRIGLTQTNLENGYDHLMDVYGSTPAP
jgi:hypothetical protein